MDALTTIQLLKSRRTKIVTTLGPASFDGETIVRLIRAGTSVFRLNMSHGNQGEHRIAIDNIRDAAGQQGVPVAIMVDLAGSKIRTGTFRGGSIELTAGQKATVTGRAVQGGPALIPCQHRELPRRVKPEDRILLDDGNVELRVDSVDGADIACSVVRGGTLRDRTGMHLPGVNTQLPTLTDKDHRDAAFALDAGADFLALSFVTSASDVLDLKKLVESRGRSTAVIAKIERIQALKEIEAILEVCDGIIVARGDLGVEVDLERVPVIQNQLVDRARAQGKPVIVATQMLESMVENSRPTRAEVTDISNAVMRGADALLLSRETAIGRHPVASVEMMDRAARHTEGYLWIQGAFGSIASNVPRTPPLPVGEAVARCTAQLSRALLTRSILVITSSGVSASQVSSARPAAPIIAVSSDEGACRRMSLLWGVIPIHVEETALETPDDLGRRLVTQLGLAREGDHILVVRGFHQDPRRSVPSVTVLTV